MANPPFAGDIKEQTILSHYELAKNDKGKWQKKVGRDILFIERNLNFLKPRRQNGCCSSSRKIQQF